MDIVYVPSKPTNELYRNENHPPVRCVLLDNKFYAIEKTHSCYAAEYYDYRLVIEVYHATQYIINHGIKALYDPATGQEIVDYLYGGLHEEELRYVQANTKLV
jgi:hypothetical protein